MVEQEDLGAKRCQEMPSTAKALAHWLNSSFSFYIVLYVAYMLLQFRSPLQLSCCWMCVVDGGAYAFFLPFEAGPPDRHS